MLDIRFSPSAFEQYNEWLISDKAIYKRLQKLIVEIARNPFEGTAKPEPLKHDLKGYWSRRINDEHRIVYRVTDEFVQIIYCKTHYS